MRGGVLKGELGSEFAVNGAGKKDSTYCLVDRVELNPSIHTDLSPASETKSSILSAF